MPWGWCCYWVHDHPAVRDNNGVGRATWCLLRLDPVGPVDARISRERHFEELVVATPRRQWLPWRFFSNGAGPRSAATGESCDNCGQIAVDLICSSIVTHNPKWFTAPNLAFG